MHGLRRPLKEFSDPEQNQSSRDLDSTFPHTLHFSSPCAIFYTQMLQLALYPPVREAMVDSLPSSAISCASCPGCLLSVHLHWSQTRIFGRKTAASRGLNVARSDMPSRQGELCKLACMPEG